MTLLLHIFEPYYQTRPYKPISGPYKFEFGALENHMLGGKYVNVHAPLENYMVHARRSERGAHKINEQFVLVYQNIFIYTM